jgi:hypothetical protein
VHPFCNLESRARNIAQSGVKNPKSINQSIELSRGVVIPLTGLTPQHF